MNTKQDSSTAGRDGAGRFAKGPAKHRAGDTLQKKIMRFRRAALAAVSVSDCKRLFKIWFDLALEGDKDAARLIFPYVFGKPELPINITETRQPAREEMSPEQMREVARAYLMAEDAERRAADADADAGADSSSNV
jgi:hypothetical protein